MSDRDAGPALVTVPVPATFVLGGVTNAYLLPGRPLTLVDPGPNTPGALAAIEAALAAHDHTLADIDQVILTHTHVDHAGLVGPLATAGASVLVHPQGEAVIRDWPAAWRERTARYARAGTAAGVPTEVMADMLGLADRRVDLGTSAPEATVVGLTDGAAVRAGTVRWRVLATPGHTVDHMCLYHAGSGTILGGDLLLRHVSTVPFLDPRHHPARQPPALADLLTSWRRVGRLPARVVWPGHGAPIRAHRILVARRLADTRGRLRAARMAVKSGADTVWSVIGQLGLSRDPEALAASLSEAAGLLEWLVHRGLLTRTIDVGVAHYRSVPAATEGV